jgi:hypothetical protein
MPDVEDLYRGKGRKRGVTELLDGRKLPIWFSARDFYLKKNEPGWNSKYDAGEVILKSHVCVGFPEFGCTIDELSESWGVKIDLIEKGYMHSFELRSIDASHEVL